MGVPILEVGNLVRWGDNLVLKKPFAFTLEAGDIGVVISQNLSSSANLLRTAAGVQTSRLNKISLGGHAITSGGAKYLLGIVSADWEFYEELTVWEQLAISAELYNVDKHYRPYAIYEALEIVQITQYKDVKLERIDDLNLRKRINIARAIVHSPRLLIIEDLFQGSDFRNWQLISDILNKIRNTGKAILVSSENLLNLDSLYSQLFLVGENEVLLHGFHPQIGQEIGQYNLVQLQVWDTGIDKAILCLSKSSAVFDILQKEDDPGVLRFFFKGDSLKLQGLVGDLKAKDIPIISCLAVDNFFGR
mgnify:FL=1